MTHEDVKKAWEEGATIEWYSPRGKKWITTSDPAWLDNLTYRIKSMTQEEVNKAWENGLDVEFYSPTFKKWVDAPAGFFYDNVSYRIKPNQDKQQYDFINPTHYKKSSKEVYEMMIDIWGVEAFIAHCEMTAFKYRMRAGTKPDQPIDRDLMKAKWYEEKATFYRKQLKNNNND